MIIMIIMIIINIIMIIIIVMIIVIVIIISTEIRRAMLEASPTGVLKIASDTSTSKPV